MGYELQVFRGEDPADEGAFEPLDEDLARDLLRRAANAGDVGAEVVVPRESLTASILLSQDDAGTLRSLWISVDAHDAAPADRRRDFRDLLEDVTGVADRLGARVWDRQREAYLTGAEIDEAVDEFGPDPAP